MGQEGGRVYFVCSLSCCESCSGFLTACNKRFLRFMLTDVGGRYGLRGRERVVGVKGPCMVRFMVPFSEVRAFRGRSITECVLRR